jgi:hypothetical protein
MLRRSWRDDVEGAAGMRLRRYRQDFKRLARRFLRWRAKQPKKEAKMG